MSRGSSEMIYISDRGIAHHERCVYAKPLCGKKPEPFALSGWDRSEWWDGEAHPYSETMPNVNRLTLAWVRPCRRCRPDLAGVGQEDQT